MTKSILNEITRISNNSKYVKWYVTIINKSLSTQYSDDVYCEKHHIIPKSFKRFVDPEILSCDDNVVILPGRDHFIAHLLLTKMFNCKIKNQKMNFAFFQMRLKNKHQEQRYVNSRFYESLKKAKPKYKKLYMSENVIYVNILDPNHYDEMILQGWTPIMPEEYKKGRVGNMIGRKHSEETKKKMRISNKLVDRSFMRGKKHSKETIEKQKETRRIRKLENPHIYDAGIKRTKEKRKQKFASGELSVKGDKNPRYGIKLSDAWKARQSEVMERNANNGMTHLELCEQIIIPALKEKPLNIKEIQQLANCNWRPHYIRSIVEQIDPNFDLSRIKKMTYKKKESDNKKHAERLQRMNNNGRTFEEIFNESLAPNITEHSNVYQIMKDLNVLMKTLRLIIERHHPEGLDFWNRLITYSVKNFKKLS